MVDRPWRGRGGVRRYLHRRRAALTSLLLVAAAAAGTITAFAVQAGPSSAATGKPVAHAAVAPVQTPTMSCSTIATLDLAALPGGPVSIASAADTTNTPGGWNACQVTGVIAPQIQFQALLPESTYQGYYLQTNCGGFCGFASITAYASTGCMPLTSGQFAMASDNQGHYGTSSFDATFGSDPQLRVDIGYRADHALALVMKALIAKFYGTGPSLSVMDGCSEGGHESLTEAQRYPHDFAGIIAGAPANIFSSLNPLYSGWQAKSNTDPNGQPILTADKLAPLHAAVLAACANQVVDGALTDPTNCHFNPASIQCPTGTDGANCLTAAQVAVVDDLYSPPHDSQGNNYYPGAQLPGSELNWAYWLVPAAGAPMSTTIDYGAALNMFRDLSLPSPDPSLTLADLHYTPATFRAVNSDAGIYNATDPDLTAFKQAGGKLIMWQGWGDPAISPEGTVAYYDAVEQRMGGAAATQSFARLFMLPGVSHCGGGQAPSNIDAVTALLKWVQQGQAPDSLVASGTTSSGGAESLPTYPYPKVTTYNGSGPTTSASSYHAANPAPEYKPVKWLGAFKSGYERNCGWVDGRWVCARAAG